MARPFPPPPPAADDDTFRVLTFDLIMAEAAEESSEIEASLDVNLSYSDYSSTPSSRT